MRELPWLMYILMALLAAGLKAYYSQATVDELSWVLAPTARVVGWLLREPLVRDPTAGWIAADGSFVIAPACAGVNFLILVFTVSMLGFTHRFHSLRQRGSWLALAVCAAYGLTIAVNAVRIVIAVGLYRAELHAGWLTPERVHRIAGTMIYLGGLWVAWLGFDHLSARAQKRTAASAWTPWFLLPAAYIGMTVILPFLNGAWRHFGMRYLEHALTVSLLAAGTLPLLSLLRWARSGAMGPGRSGPLATRGTRDGGHGQAADSGGGRRAGDR